MLSRVGSEACSCIVEADAHMGCHQNRLSTLPLPARPPVVKCSDETSQKLVFLCFG